MCFVSWIFALPIFVHIISARGGGRATATRMYTYVNKANVETIRKIQAKRRENITPHRQSERNSGPLPISWF